MSNQASAVSPFEALDRLVSGNQRFVSGEHTHADRIGESRRKDLSNGQAPFAAILTCADSRTPPEHIFDAGLGELFVCRNAGNIVDEVILGSIEYSAAHTGCPLVCVLGHTSCGAVGATLAAARNPESHETHNVDDIIRRIMPAVMATAEGQTDDKEWTDTAAKKNVVNSCKHFMQRSPLLKDMVLKGRFGVVGAWYDLGSGTVEILYKTIDPLNVAA
jgi:carbonic anhydrase